MKSPAANAQLDSTTASGPRSVVAIGNFDGVHLGHRAVLAQARALADERGVPRVLDVLRPPRMREAQPLRADGIALPLGRRVQIEERAVRVEDVDPAHGCALPRMRWMIPEKSVPPSPQAACSP